MTAESNPADASPHIDAVLNEGNVSGNIPGDDSASTPAVEAAKDVLKDARDRAAEAAEPLKDEAAGLAEKGKKKGADRLSDFACALHDAAEAIGRETPKGSRYVHAGADRLDDISDTLRNKSLDELITKANDAAHERPMTFFAGSLIAGFALARFLRSSAGGMQSR